jgi:hypothetical protein
VSSKVVVIKDVDMIIRNPLAPDPPKEIRYPIDETQQAQFAFKAIPDLFHQSPEKFISMLKKDGNRFLAFYWDEVGKRLNLDEKTVPYGLNYEIQQHYLGTTIMLLSLPRPARIGEVFYEALIYRPYRVTMFFLASDTTKVLALENQGEDTENPVADLVEIDRKLDIEKVRECLLPQKEQFIQAVLDELKD